MTLINSERSREILRVAGSFLREETMPLYEYACRDCESQFELLVRGSEQPQCPQCASDQLVKQLSVPAAPAASAGELPVCRPAMPAGCGLPQCGRSGCGM